MGDAKQQKAMTTKSVGEQASRAFNEGDWDEAWYKERWLRKLENMTAEEYERQYLDDTYE